jgi:hypothetical protein
MPVSMVQLDAAPQNSMAVEIATNARIVASSNVQGL